MVSKINKKTPTKSIKDCRSARRQKKTPIKNKNNVLASINKSLFTCQRRLIKIFSKLAKITTPTRRKKQGFQLLKKQQIPQDSSPPAQQPLARKSLPFDNNLLPPLLSPLKKTVFLDLDETLVHSKPDPMPGKFDFVVRPKIDGELLNFYVLKRPGVDEFLESLAEKFEVVVFTAGLREYASLVLDRLDRKAVISHRLYRDSCKEVEGKFVKDLSALGRDLRRVVIVDDNPNAYVFQPENAIPVRPFVDDLGDRELGRLIEFFEGSDCFDDMRDAVKSHLAQRDKKLEL